jgi:hypothetical protein
VYILLELGNYICMIKMYLQAEGIACCYAISGLLYLCVCLSLNKLIWT